MQEAQTSFVLESPVHHVVVLICARCTFCCIALFNRFKSMSIDINMPPVRSMIKTPLFCFFIFGYFIFFLPSLMPKRETEMTPINFINSLKSSFCYFNRTNRLLITVLTVMIIFIICILSFALIFVLLFFLFASLTFTDPYDDTLTWNCISFLTFQYPAVFWVVNDFALWISR